MKLHNNIISDSAGDRLKITYELGMCWGCSVVSPAQPGEKSSGNQFIIDSIRLDGIVKEDVLLLKVDVEGFEVIAIDSADGIFSKYNIFNILVEWTPHRWNHDVERGTKLLEKLSDAGYVIRHYDLRPTLPDSMTTNFKEFPIAGRTWEVPRSQLKAMNEFLMKNGYGEANLWLTKEKLPL